jgi:solute carrier family 25 aspartate/glutamate transporter 12/13
VPFSAIYFTSYAHLKKDVFREGENGKKLSFVETLTAAGIAGMPAAYLTTPADVVKTRIQSVRRLFCLSLTVLTDLLVSLPGSKEGLFDILRYHGCLQEDIN